MQREVVFDNPHHFVVIEVHFFIDHVEDAILPGSIREGLEEAFLFFIEGKSVGMGKQSRLELHFLSCAVKFIVIHGNSQMRSSFLAFDTHRCIIIDDQIDSLKLVD